LTLARLALALIAFRLRHIRCGAAVRYFDASDATGALRTVVVACSRHHLVRRWTIDERGEIVVETSTYDT